MFSSVIRVPYPIPMLFAASHLKSLLLGEWKGSGRHSIALGGILEYTLFFPTTKNVVFVSIGSISRVALIPLFPGLRVWTWASEVAATDIAHPKLVRQQLGLTF